MAAMVDATVVKEACLVNVTCLVDETCLMDGVMSMDTAMDQVTLTLDVVVSLGVVDDLSLNWQVLNSFPCSFDGFVFNNSLLNFLRNVLNLSFNCVVVSNSSFNWNSFSVDNFFIFNNFLLVWDSFNSFDSVVLDIFLFEGNILNSAFNWDLFSNSLMMMNI